MKKFVFTLKSIEPWAVGIRMNNGWFFRPKHQEGPFGYAHYNYFEIRVFKASLKILLKRLHWETIEENNANTRRAGELMAKHGI